MRMSARKLKKARTRLETDVSWYVLWRTVKSTEFRCQLKLAFALLAYMFRDRPTCILVFRPDRHFL